MIGWEVGELPFAISYFVTIGASNTDPAKGISDLEERFLLPACYVSLRAFTTMASDASQYSPKSLQPALPIL